MTHNGHKLSDPYINGCLYCANYLPNCTVCLRVMKINLITTPNVQTPLTNPTASHLIIPLHRSKSLYTPSATICHPGMNSTGSASKIPYDLQTNALISPPMAVIHKSSSGGQYKNGQIYMTHSNNSNNPIEIESNEEPEEEKNLETLRKEIQKENIEFLNTNKFGKWFSWCQTCKHGGHLNHLMDWFKTHEHCPFLHCKCQCLNSDNHHER